MPGGAGGDYARAAVGAQGVAGRQPVWSGGV